MFSRAVQWAVFAQIFLIAATPVIGATEYCTTTQSICTSSSRATSCCDSDAHKEQRGGDSCCIVVESAHDLISPSIVESVKAPPAGEATPLEPAIGLAAGESLRDRAAYRWHAPDPPPPPLRTFLALIELRLL